MIYTFNKYSNMLHDHQNDTKNWKDQQYQVLQRCGWLELSCIARESVNWLGPHWKTFYKYLLKENMCLPYEFKISEHMCS